MNEATLQELEETLDKLESQHCATIVLWLQDAQQLTAMVRELQLQNLALAQRLQMAQKDAAELNRVLASVPEYTFACLQAKERGEVSFVSLSEWYTQQEPSA